MSCVNSFRILVKIFVCSTEYVNDWDEVIAFQCSHNGYITGIDSYHDNHVEDRRFKFRCCETTGELFSRLTIHFKDYFLHMT